MKNLNETEIKELMKVLEKHASALRQEISQVESMFPLDNSDIPYWIKRMFTRVITKFLNRYSSSFSLDDMISADDVKVVYNNLQKEIIISIKIEANNIVISIADQDDVAYILNEVRKLQSLTQITILLANLEYKETNHYFSHYPSSTNKNETLWTKILMNASYKLNDHLLKTESCKDISSIIRLIT